LTDSSDLSAHQVSCFPDLRALAVSEQSAEASLAEPRVGSQAVPALELSPKAFLARDHRPKGFPPVVTTVDGRLADSPVANLVQS
jgi:hypothetical protein